MSTIGGRLGSFHTEPLREEVWTASSVCNPTLGLTASMCLLYLGLGVLLPSEGDRLMTSVPSVTSSQCRGLYLEQRHPVLFTGRGIPWVSFGHIPGQGACLPTCLRTQSPEPSEDSEHVTSLKEGS